MHDTLAITSLHALLARGATHGSGGTWWSLSMDAEGKLIKTQNPSIAFGRSQRAQSGRAGPLETESAISSPVRSVGSKCLREGGIQ